jgi:peptide-methionine (S)-S-oxide reductase
MNPITSQETATLAGGCFWCMEAVFQQIEGVESVVSGYTGGTTLNPTYEQVCSDRSGHAEAVQVTFDPSRISYRDILEIFFSVHNPTTLNRQGEDMGTQYRSAIFYNSDEQKAVAAQLIRELDQARVWKNPIVTQVLPLDKFYPAEDYHRDYFARHPEQAYCQMVISPKVVKLHRQWAKRLRQPPAK